MTKSINLPLHKKSVASQLLGTYIKIPVDGKLKYIARFSYAYQPKGHNFNPSFKVLRSAYRNKYALLTTGDITVYQELQYLCEMDESFTQIELAHYCRIDTKTLRRHLDNLVNCELLDIVIIKDAAGKPQTYLIRAPFYESATFTPEIERRILDAGEVVPTKFLETEAERLRRQISENHWGIYRRARRKKREEMSNLEREMFDFFQDHSLAVGSVFGSMVTITLGKNGNPAKTDVTRAAEFNQMVWEKTREMPDLRGEEYWAVFKRFVKAGLEQIGMKYTEHIFGAAKELAAFYGARVRRAAIVTAAAVKPPAPVCSSTGDAMPQDKPFVPTYVYNEKEENRRSIVRAMREVSDKGESRGWKPTTLREFVDYFRSRLRLFSPAELTEIAAGFFPVKNCPDVKWQKIFDEL